LQHLGFVERQNTWGADYRSGVTARIRKPIDCMLINPVEKMQAGPDRPQ